MAEIDYGASLYRTEDTITSAELERLIDHDEDDGPLEDVIQTHDGEWRRDGDVFRWWQHDDEMDSFYLPRVEMEPADVDRR